MDASLGKQFADYSYQSYSWKFLEQPALDRLLVKHLKKNLKVVDAGCGNGRTVRYLTDNGVYSEGIVGIDVSDQLLNIAKRDFPKSTFINADITKWTTAEKFDLVTCIFVLHYFKVLILKKILKNFSSYIKKNGILVYMVPHPIRWTKDNLREYFNRKSGLIKASWGEKIPYSHKPIEDYINLTIQAGFEILRVDECEVVKGGTKDKKNYEKYSAFPSRFAILARKK